MKCAYFFFTLFILTSCDLAEVFTKPNAREVYHKELSTEELDFFKTLGGQAFLDHVVIKAPYRETLIVDKSKPIATGFTIDCQRGEVLNLGMNTSNLFIDIYKLSEDSIGNFEPVLEPDNISDEYNVEVEMSGLYFIRLQSKLSQSDTLELRITTSPALDFPISGGKNADIGGFWGDPRDGGKRKHKGIDIFAKKGTPLIAATDGSIRNVRNRGLGGKQIWLYDAKRDMSIYYAHLDSQYVKKGELVFRGDTIGSVGNTGNAKRTPPHLHFGIYASGQGAIDPLTFVKTQKSLRHLSQLRDNFIPPLILSKSTSGSFRLGPSKKAHRIRKLTKDEKFEVLGVSGQWYHVRDIKQVVGFVHSSDLLTDLPS